MSTLEISGIAKSFGATPVLSDLALRVADGCLAAVLGPSGCGKTTLLRLVAGFERADAGSIEVGGRTLAGPGRHLPPERRGVGVVPQEGALFPHLPVAWNVAFGVRGRGKEERAAEMLRLVGLEGYGPRMPHELSGGQQQRVALARALAPEPALVLLDEPFNALDPGLRAALRQEVREVLRVAGVTALLVTHDQEEALSTADVVALMRGGRVVQSGPPRDVYEHPYDAGLAEYLGETVVLPGTLENGSVWCALGRLDPGRHVDRTGGRGRVVLRPERIVLDPGQGVPAQVKAVTFAGHDTVVQLAVEEDGTEIHARSHGYPPPEVGSTVNVRVAGEVSFFPGPPEETRSGQDRVRDVRTR
ncbi:ABC transporter ATP-binding protein [Allosalinactinospora lopnorensis]|uniref:ABC transporter ATP-binding protein n=1 Tax=Allosalinactinospora lopnorensis TaxID=1352348 RepID=UPI000623F85B|nr:ABC transporter ATP-binding protein [Allosalinactinospora lopnorensis]